MQNQTLNHRDNMLTHSKSAHNLCLLCFMVKWKSLSIAKEEKRKTTCIICCMTHPIIFGYLYPLICEICRKLIVAIVPVRFAAPLCCIIARLVHLIGI